MCDGDVNTLRHALKNSSCILNLSWKLVSGIRRITLIAGKGLAEHLPQRQRQHLLRAIEFIDTDKNKILTPLASMQESKLKTACSLVGDGVRDMTRFCQEWNIGQERPAASVERAPQMEALMSNRYYKQAMNDFKDAKSLAYQVFHDRSLRSSIRIGALDVLMFCQMLLHWQDYSHWFDHWTSLFEAFFSDHQLRNIAMGETTLKDRLAGVPEKKVVRERMIKLIDVYAELIVALVIAEPSLAVDARKFVNKFNEHLHEFKLHSEWKPLLGDENANFVDRFWFKGNWGRIDYTPLDQGEKFVYVDNIKHMAWVAPGLMYGVNSKGHLVSIDSTSPTRRDKVAGAIQGNWKIFGYASDQDLLYASVCETKILYFDANGNELHNASAIKYKHLPIEGGKISDYVFLVASNGSMIAYHNLAGEGRRYASFPSRGSAWIKLMDPKHKHARSRIKAGDKLIVIGEDKDNHLLRLSVRCKKEVVKIQAEDISESRGCSFHKFYVEAQFHDGALTTDVSRIAAHGRREINIYLIGNKEEKSQGSAWSHKPMLAKLQMVVENGQVKKFHKAHKEYPVNGVSKMSRITYGDGTIFCDGFEDEVQK